MYKSEKTRCIEDRDPWVEMGLCFCCFFGGKNETGMGIYIVLDGNRNADHVFCRWRAAGGSADCRNHACFLSVVFLLIAAQKKNRHTTVLIFAY